MLNLLKSLLKSDEPAALTVQQQMVLQQQYTALSMLKDSNAALDQKAGTFLTAGGFMVTLTTALGIPGVIYSDPSPYALGAMAVTAAAFLRMLYVSIRSVNPKAQAIPGSKGWDDVFNHYLLMEAEDSFNSILANLLNNREQLLKVNASKSKQVRAAAWSLVIQIVALTFTAIILNLT